MDLHRAQRLAPLALAFVAAACHPPIDAGLPTPETCSFVDVLGYPNASAEMGVLVDGAFQPFAPGQAVELVANPLDETISPWAIVTAFRVWAPAETGRVCANVGLETTTDVGGGQVDIAFGGGNWWLTPDGSGWLVSEPLTAGVAADLGAVLQAGATTEVTADLRAFGAGGAAIIAPASATITLVNETGYLAPN